MKYSTAKRAGKAQESVTNKLQSKYGLLDIFNTGPDWLYPSAEKLIIFWYA
jgi:hypothetical protein